MTRSTASGAVRRPMASVASIPRRASTATALARTSASGAARPRPAPVASTARPAGMKNEVEEESMCAVTFSQFNG